MPLLTPKTQLEQDLAAKDESVLRAAEATNHLAAVLKNENELFWSLPTDRLLAVLNHDVPTTLATFAANTATGNAINATLDLLHTSEATAEGIGASFTIGSALEHPYK